MRKRYIVFVQDEWNNNYLIDVFDKLSDAVKPINEFISSYDVQIDSLDEYPSTLAQCFDQQLDTPLGETIYIRGFIWFDKELDKDVQEIKEEHPKYKQLSLFDEE